MNYTEMRDVSQIQDKTRRACGIISAFLAIFFLAHALLGGAYVLGLISATSAFLVWIGIVIVAVHVAVCIATSYQMLTDDVRPPSSKKKKHLVLKWVTGGLLVLCIAVHVLRTGGIVGLDAHTAFLVETLVLTACLAIHLYVGTKSLLKDLNIDRSYRNAVRIAFCAIAAVVALELIAGL